MTSRRLFVSNLLATALLLAFFPVGAEPVRDGSVSAELIADSVGITPGKPFTIALRLSNDPGWHTYWINPGDSGLPTKIEWQMPSGFSAGPIQYPFPHKFVVDFGGFKQIGLGYEGESVHLIEITPPADLPLGTPVTLTGKVSWLMCDDKQCVPGGVTVNVTIPVAAEPGLQSPEIVALFTKARANLPADAPDWTVSVSPQGDKNLTFTVTPPADATLPDAAGLVLYPESPNLIDLGEEQAFRVEAGKWILELPKAAYAGDKLPSPLAVVLISEGGFPDMGGRHAVRVTDAARAPEVADFDPSPSQINPPTPTDSPKIGSDPVSPEVSVGPFGGGVLGYLIAGFLGGMILNIMPCVFPVISLKILGFVSHAGDERRKVLLHSALYTLGILFFFVGLAAILIVVQAGWGAFQFQNPWFVMLMTAILVVLSLNLFGVFEMGLKLTSVGGNLTQSSGYAGSFWSGALAVILAAPCTGPFLGTSLGWAFTQTPVVNLTFFTMMGLGMAAPYVLLTAFPKLLALMPRPGPWMETFKQVMGFPMLAAAVYMLWILGGQIGDTGQAFFMGALILLGLAAWAWGKYGGYAAAGKKSRIPGLATAVISLVAAIILALVSARQAPASSAEENTDSRPIAEIIESHRQAGKNVFVDFTARWCAICQTNKPAMYSDETKAAFAQHGVEFVVADWTNQNDDIFQFLKKQGRRSVPYYPLFPADTSKGPIELPQNLTTGIILDHLKKLENVPANFPVAVSQ